MREREAHVIMMMPQWQPAPGPERRGGHSTAVVQKLGQACEVRDGAKGTVPQRSFCHTKRCVMQRVLTSARSPACAAKRLEAAPTQIRSRPAECWLASMQCKPLAPRWRAHRLQSSKRTLQSLLLSRSSCTEQLRRGTVRVCYQVVAFSRAERALHAKDNPKREHATRDE